MCISWKGKQVDVFKEGVGPNARFFVLEDIENAVLQGDNKIIVTTENYVMVSSRTADWQSFQETTRTLR